MRQREQAAAASSFSAYRDEEIKDEDKKWRRKSGENERAADAVELN